MGRQTIFEINKLLLSSKEAFTDSKTTKSVIDFIMYIIGKEPKLSPVHCDAINNCLLLLRNVLHSPEIKNNFIQHNGQMTSMQNTIIWNLFIQGIDKVLLYLMTCQKRTCWSVTMVQLIAVLYKDQHRSTLQKSLKIWFEEAISESSEDNESNTSPSKQCSGESSPMLTLSDPTSDSSDNCAGRKNENNDKDTRQASPTEATLQEVCRKGQEYQDAMKASDAENKKNTSVFAEPTSPNSFKSKSPYSGQISLSVGKSSPQKRTCPSSQSDLSDCGYGTQIEPHGSISTSSNEEDGPTKSPVHQKPPTNQRTKQRTVMSEQQRKDIRKRKLLIRSRSNL